MNPDKAYIINTATYVITDGGKTFVPVEGAPGAMTMSSSGSVEKMATGWFEQLTRQVDAA